MFILLAMIFLHIIDDFFIQSAWLANGKQRSWWEEHAPKAQYKYDYLMALFMHSFSWAFMVMLPIAYTLKFNVDVSFIIAFTLNLIIHFSVDNAKANHSKLNLIQDQLIHLVQIIATFLIFL